MKDDKIDTCIEQVARGTLEVLTSISAKGEKLTSDDIKKGLSSHREIRGIFNSIEQSSGSRDRSFQLTVKDEDESAGRLDVLKSQKDQLLQQVGAMEEEGAKTVRFYNRSLHYFIDMIHAEDKKTGNTLEKIKRLIKNDAGMPELEDAIEKLKNQKLKEGLVKRAVSGRKQKGFLLAKLFKGGNTVADSVSDEKNLMYLKDICREIIDNVRLDVEKKFLDKITDIEKALDRIITFDDYFSIRGSILSLVHDYLSDVGEKRREAAQFVQEVTRRLVEIEQYILESISYAEVTRQASNDFNVLLEVQVEEMEGSVSFSKTFEDLKSAVVSRLSAIKSAVERKKKEDAERQKDSSEKINYLQNSFNRMKIDFDAANERAKKLEAEVLTDPLTGINNRRAYDNRIKEEFIRYQRYGHIFSSMIMDIDDFKKINDTYGHFIGDKCLQEVVNKIKPLVRESDFFARFGGEEFVILLPEADSGAAGIVAEKVRQIVEKTEFMYKNEIIRITISIGVTQVKQTDARYESMFDRMDKAVYDAKETGRNKVVTF
ncbi:MAG: GGDEF domain-containing protein [Desulfobacterales bacterium]|nr:GGDEF domain-containing protein [Desulfobacterales bacterium]